MADAKNKYSKEELKEFEQIILAKLQENKDELGRLKKQIRKTDDNGTDNTAGGIRSIDDGIESTEKEELSRAAGRIQKYVDHLEKALIRINHGTYGVCVQTGELISKDRLRLVPHTQHSVAAKNSRG